MSIKKQKIVLDIEHDILIDLRKSLFRRGISVQSFFTHVADLVSMCDDKMEQILDEIPKHKEKRTINKSAKLDAEALYALIEQNNKKQNGAEYDPD